MMQHQCFWLSPLCFFVGDDAPSMFLVVVGLLVRGGGDAQSMFLVVQHLRVLFSLGSGSDFRCENQGCDACPCHCTKSAQEPWAIEMLR